MNEQDSGQKNEHTPASDASDRETSKKHDNVPESKQQEKKEAKKRLNRKKLVARSTKKINEVNKIDPYLQRPYSPVERVNLTVSGTIVRIDKRLKTDESLDEEDVASLEHSLDFLGLMIDKLESPKKESPPEVVAAVAVLLGPLLEEPEQNADVFTQPEIMQQTLADDMKDLLTVISATTPAMIDNYTAVEQSEKLESNDEIVANNSVEGGTSKVLTSNEHQVSSSTTETLDENWIKKMRSIPGNELTRVDPEKILETANDYRRMVPTVMRVLKKERRKSSQSIVAPAVIAPVVYAASAGGDTPVEETARLVSGPSKTSQEPEVEQTTSNGVQILKKETIELTDLQPHSNTQRDDVKSQFNKIELPDMQTQKSIEGRSPNTQIASQEPHTVALAKTSFAPQSPVLKEVKYLSLPELLHEAKHISLPHNDMLRKAYDRGDIDALGLKDVIKSHRKGTDYLSAYYAQRAMSRKRKLEQSSSNVSSDHEKEPIEPKSEPQSQKLIHEVTDASHPEISTVQQIEPSPIDTSEFANQRDDRQELLGTILTSNQPKATSNNWIRTIAIASALVGLGVAIGVLL